MTLISGINHVAIVTEDLQRFIEFYGSVFEMKTLFTEHTPAFSHAILQLGADSWLHPAQVHGSPHGTGLPDYFSRGHLDHLGLTAPSAAVFEVIRERLVSRGASTGSVESLGAFHSTWFCDPDGMKGELCLVVDSELRDFHAPRALR